VSAAMSIPERTPEGDHRPVPAPVTTQTSSTRRRRRRAIQAAMTASSPRRIRPDHQAASVLLRMSAEERDALHTSAREAGFESTVAYVLALHKDATRRGVSPQGARPTTVTNSESPDPVGRGAHAEAGHEVAAAAS